MLRWISIYLPQQRHTWVVHGLNIQDQVLLLSVFTLEMRSRVFFWECGGTSKKLRNRGKATYNINTVPTHEILKQNKIKKNIRKPQNTLFCDLIVQPLFLSCSSERYFPSLPHIAVCPLALFCLSHDCLDLGFPKAKKYWFVFILFLCPWKTTLETCVSSGNYAGKIFLL